MKGIHPKKSWSLSRRTRSTLTTGQGTGRSFVDTGVMRIEDEFQKLESIELRHRHIFEGVSSGQILLDREGKLVSVNQAALRMLGLRLSELRELIERGQGTDFYSTREEQGNSLPWEIFNQREMIEVCRRGYRFPVEVSGVSTRWLKCYAHPIRHEADGQPKYVIITLEDVTEQIVFEDHEVVLKELTHRVLRQEPLSEIMDYLCNTLVNTLGYTSACIGIKAPDGRILFPHRAGVGADILPQVKICWDDSTEGQGAMGTALRTGKSQTHILIGHERHAIWRDAYLKLGLMAIGVIPLLEEMTGYGVLGLYSTDECCFTAQRMSLLEQFGNEVSLALTAVKGREQMEYYQLLAEESQEIIFFIDDERRIIEANRKTIETYGYTREELLGMNVMKLRALRAKGDFYPSLKKVLHERLEYETMHIRRDGTEFPVEVTATAAMLRGKLVLMVINRDITQRKRTQDLLHASEARYREIMETMSNAVAVTETTDGGKSFILTEFNRAAEELENFRREEVLGRTLKELYPKTEADEFHRVVREVWETGKSRHMKIKIEVANKGWSRRELDLYRLLSGEVVGIYQDVTREKLAIEALWLEKERAQVTLSAIGDAVLIVGLSLNIEYMNPVAEEMTGWKLAEARGLLLEHILYLETEQGKYIKDHPVVRCLREDGRVQKDLDTVLWHRAGQRFTVEASASSLRDGRGKLLGVVLVLRNVTQQRELMQQLLHQAHHDPLTGLPNRLAFQDRLGVSIAQAHRKGHGVAVLFLDIDHFKLVNDSYGHAVGDHLLCEIAERLSSALREADTVSRQGGDEFIIILPEVHEAWKVAKVALKILSTVMEPFLLGPGAHYATTVSIGISLYPQDGEDVDTLVKHADIAMYLAKSKGRNNYQFFTAELSNILQQQFSLQANLRGALERKEFVLHYQPIFDLRTREILGVEALVRWQIPKQGIIPPGDFIPMAEETGLILPIGEWVLHEASSQVRKWQNQGLGRLYVAVNLSACQFRQPNLVQTILEILSTTGLDPECLQLEITESVAAEDISLTAELLYQLKKVGIRISIDDFGTGFSSLSYLHRLPFDTLKIDKSFVADLDTRSSHQIVESILGLAKNLDLKVIAEGVETEAQLDYLQGTSCQAGQGYYISRPLSAQQFETKMLLTNQKP